MHSLALLLSVLVLTAMPASTQQWQHRQQPEQQPPAFSLLPQQQRQQLQPRQASSCSQERQSLCTST
jgi:hypothetical protein